MADMKIAMILGMSESKALMAYADREGMKPKDAALKLLVDGIRLAARQVRCACCDGSGYVDAARDP